MAAVMAIAENLRGPAVGRPSAADARRYWLQAKRNQLTPYLFIAPNMALFSVFVFFRCSMRSTSACGSGA
jgi:multiple sugar transport system permease protein